tara:strand:+ start:5370 stop:6293 length:924 start_codon:yes stop_codon:yes gene_type:complete
MAINKISGVLATAISTIAGVATSGISKINSVVLSLFTNTNAVAKSITTGTAQAVYVTDSNSMGVEWDEDDDFSISFWIKPGWDTSLNTHIHIFSMSDVGGGINSDTFRIWYDDTNNRLNVQWRSCGTCRKHNFWTFHSNSGKYAPAYAAAGLGTTYWNSGNRGNVGDDDYTLITFCKGALDSAADTNIDMYWNGTTLGTSHYTSGNHTATAPSMGNNDKQIFLGSQSWSAYAKSGNNTETKFDGVTMWNKKLTAAEVDELWNDGTPIDATTHSAASELKGYWEFESDGTATVGENMTINGDSNIETR